jgi:hypothetical protein
MFLVYKLQVLKNVHGESETPRGQFHHTHQVAAFDLDTHCSCGRVALMYVDGHTDPQVGVGVGCFYYCMRELMYV